MKDCQQAVQLCRGLGSADDICFCDFIDLQLRSRRHEAQAPDPGSDILLGNAGLLRQVPSTQTNTDKQWRIVCNINEWLLSQYIRGCLLSSVGEASDEFGEAMALHETHLQVQGGLLRACD